MRVLALCLALLAGLLLQAGGDMRAWANEPAAPCESAAGLHHHNPNNSHCDHAAALPGAAGQMAKALPRLQPGDAVLSFAAPLRAAAAPLPRQAQWWTGAATIADPPQLAFIRVTRLLI